MSQRAQEKVSQTWIVLQDRLQMQSLARTAVPSTAHVTSSSPYWLHFCKSHGRTTDRTLHLGPSVTKRTLRPELFHVVTVNLTIEELLSKTYDLTLVARYLLCLRDSHRVSEGSSLLSSRSCIILSYVPLAFAYFNMKQQIETQKHNCLQENLPWLISLEEISRKLHRGGKFGTKWKECPDNLGIENLL